MTSHGTSFTKAMTGTEITIATNAEATAVFDSFRLAIALTAAAVAPAAARPIKTCSDDRVPIPGIRNKLNANAPMIEPAVFAAYTSPESCAGSSPGSAAAANASGKLAPQRSVAGRIAKMHRTTSSWKLNTGLNESQGSTGQYGSE